MPKQKTRKSAFKRFRLTKTGKVLRRVSFGRHLRSTKSASQKRGFKKPKRVTGRVARRIKRMLAKA